MGVLGVLEKGGAHSRRFGYFCLYSWTHGMGFGLRGRLKSPKNNIDNGYDDFRHLINTLCISSLHIHGQGLLLLLFNQGSIIF